MQLKKAKKVLFLIIPGFLLLRIGLALLIDNFKLFEVHFIAENLVTTGEMKYHLNGQVNYNYQFPVYPFLLYLIYLFCGVVPFWGAVFNCILHSLSVFISFYIFKWFAERSTNKTIVKHAILIALLGALATLLHPFINYYSLMIIHPFSLNLFLMFLSVYCLILYFDNQTTLRFSILGIVFGISLLDRTTMLILIVPFFLYFFVNSTIITAIKKSLILFFFGFLILIPWLYRNYNIYERVSINSSLGQNLWLGIQEKTGGSAYLTNGDTYYSLLPESEWKFIEKLNAVEQSDYFLDKYKKKLRENPLLFSKMFLVKLNNFWIFREGIGTEYSESIKKLIPLYKITYTLILFLCIYYVFRYRRSALILFSIPISLSLFHAMFYVETRHRIIIEPILVFLCLCSIFAIIGYFKNGKRT